MAFIYKLLEIVKVRSPFHPLVCAINPGIDLRERSLCLGFEKHSGIGRTHVHHNVSETGLGYFLHIRGNLRLTVGVVIEICR